MKRLMMIGACAAAGCASPLAAQQDTAAARTTTTTTETDPSSTSPYAVTTAARPLNVEAVVEAMKNTYPPVLNGAGIGGRVVVSLVVGTDGVPADLEVVSTDHPLFNEPTLAAMRLLRFAPAQTDGHPVRVRVRIPLEWRVEEPLPPAPKP
ncbi:energy transducer TonB [Longimicrobium terrae]|uniref:TonB family protein n=1 Tax=Longimicrobium terrae TaxID=1639882 RepID=A0A841GVN9_9BACT|nr:energy transducer TonB [Longimicrobium terrae]MBB4635454.1 TonB family protein [Longimicrobium terrae]MBB6069848.1 TonB family protein [Longimicrobium terrae]NNC30948.1 energy transducer TonB [Longimicrobium terrae]NNC32766.1 energy transducer TonB [Longimicrobium terrae]